MKYVSYLILLSLFSCAPALKIIPKEVNLYAIDFRKYTDQNFLITPEKYIGDYKSIGILNFTFIPMANYATKQVRYHDGTTGTVGSWIIERMNIYEGLDSLYSISKSMGADAIMNFKATTTTRVYSLVSNPVTLEGIELSGFAIKREQ